MTEDRGQRTEFVCRCAAQLKNRGKAVGECLIWHESDQAKKVGRTATTRDLTGITLQKTVGTKTIKFGQICAPNGTEVSKKAPEYIKTNIQPVVETAWPSRV